MASFLLALIFLLDGCGGIKGATPVILSPSGVAPVCSGGQLELTCTTAGGFQEWDFHISENMTAITYGRLVNNQAGLIIMPVVTESIIFNISRVSLPERLPLVSKLSITTERSTANGTEVTCTCIDAVTNARASTTVAIISKSSVLQDHPVVNITWALEQSDNGSTRNVTLTWNETVNPALFSYHVFITPDAPYTFAETKLTIEILLRITYNVSIVAAHICGQTTSIVTAGLFYPDCGGQLNDVNLLGIIDYLNPGDRNITFRDCPPAMTPTDHEGAMTYVSMGVMMTDVANIIGGTIGSLLGVILITGTISIVIIGAIMLARRKGVMNLYKGKPQDECSRSDVELEPPQEDSQGDNKNASRGLVYAEIGKSSSNHQQNQQLPNFLDLDDSRIEYAQLNHQAPTKLPVVQNKLVDESLSVSLDNLLIQLRPQVGSKWYQFGQAAGIRKEVLDKFTQQCSPEDCIVEMLDYWLRKHEIPPTWKDVANILKEINLPQLALGIEQVYSTGKLPVEVDVNWTPQFQQDNSEAGPPPPPPVPPKMTTQDWDEFLSDHDQVTQPDSSAPPLPPKPWYETSSTNVPARPPKPTAARAPINDM